MPTTYAAAVSLAESMYITPTNPHGWVPGFDKDPAKFLQENVQPYADAGIKLMLHNAFGRGGKTRTFSKRFDGQPASVTAAEWMSDTPKNQLYALSNFIMSPGMEGTLFYVGAPDINLGHALDRAVSRLYSFKHLFPDVIPFYDNTGDIDSSELCAGSALFAAHDAMERQPFYSPIPWGIEPNPAKASRTCPRHYYRPTYVYGSVLNWSAKSRIQIEDCPYGTIPIVAIRGDEYTTVNVRIAAAKQWGPRVAPYNGIVVVHGVSVAEMEGLTR